MKHRIASLVATLALVGLGATNVIAADAKAPGKPVAKATKMEHMQLSLTGVTAENRAEIEKMAREQGAKSASLNVQTGELKLSVADPKAFNRADFEKKLGEKLPTVSLK